MRSKARVLKGLILIHAGTILDFYDWSEPVKMKVSDVCSDSKNGTFWQGWERKQIQTHQAKRHQGNTKKLVWTGACLLSIKTLAARANFKGALLQLYMSKCFFFFLQRLDCTFSSLKKLLKLCQLGPGDQKSSEESHVWWTRGLKFEHVGVYQAGECERGCSVPVFLDLGPNVSSSASHFDCSFLKNPVSCESHYGLTLLNSWVSPLIRIFHANNKMRHAVSLIRCLLVKSQEQFDGFLYLLSCWV